MMGAGIDALTVRKIDPQAKRRFRELAFVGTGVQEGLAQRSPVFLVRTNGEEYRATFMVAGNSRYYGGRFGVTSMADPTDGVLDLVLYTGTEPAGPWPASGWACRAACICAARTRSTCMPQKAEVLPLANDEPDLVPDRRRAGRQAAGHGGDRPARYRGAGAVRAASLLPSSNSPYPRNAPAVLMITSSMSVCRYG